MQKVWALLTFDRSLPMEGLMFPPRPFHSLCLLLLICLISGSGFAQDRSVISSIYPVKLILKEILPDRFEITNLISANQDPHFYEPRPSDIQKLEGAYLFVRVDPLLESFRLSAKRELHLLPLLPESEIILSGFGPDPHFWLSARAVRSLLPGLVDNLCRIWSDDCESIKSRSENFEIRLTSLLENLRKTPSQTSDLHLLASHDSFAYLCRDMGWQCLSFAGGSHHHDTSASEMSRMIRKLREVGSFALIEEISISSQSIPTLAKSLSTKTVKLDPLGLSPRQENYEAFLRHIVEGILGST